MKLTIIFLLAVSIQANANINPPRVTIYKANARIEEILLDIYRQTGYMYSVNTTSLEKAGRVTIRVQYATIEEVLDRCFNKLSLTYSIQNNIIIIFEAASVHSQPSPDTSGEKKDTVLKKPQSHETIIPRLIVLDKLKDLFEKVKDWLVTVLQYSPGFSIIHELAAIEVAVSKIIELFNQLFPPTNSKNKISTNDTKTNREKMWKYIRLVICVLTVAYFMVRLIN